MGLDELIVMVSASFAKKNLSLFQHPISSELVYLFLLEEAEGFAGQIWTNFFMKGTDLTLLTEKFSQPERSTKLRSYRRLLFNPHSEFPGLCSAEPTSLGRNPCLPAGRRI
jgi:hypothetical protein